MSIVTFIYAKNHCRYGKKKDGCKNANIFKYILHIYICLFKPHRRVFFAAVGKLYVFSVYRALRASNSLLRAMK